MTVTAPETIGRSLRRARWCAVSALVVTAGIGLLVWDTLGILLGAPLAALALIGLVRARRRTASRTDRRAVAVTLATVAAWALLSAFIGAGAQGSGSTAEDLLEAFCAATEELEGEPLPVVQEETSRANIRAAYDEYVARTRGVAIETVELAPDAIRDELDLLRKRITDVARTGELSLVRDHDYRMAEQQVGAFRARRCVV